MPWREGSGDVERGKSSYQLEKRARSRSTQRCSSLDVRGEGEVGIAGGELFDLGGERVLVEGGLHLRRGAQGCGDRLQLFGVGTVGEGRGLVEEVGADGEGNGDVLRREVALRGVGRVGLRGKALAQVVAPGVEVVDPGPDGEGPGAELVDGEAGGPQIVGQFGHGSGAPGAFAVGLVEEARGDVIVAVGEDGGRDVDAVAQDAAGGITAAVHLRLDLFDDDSFTAFGRFHSFRSPGFAASFCLFHPIGRLRECYRRLVHLIRRLM